MQLSDKAVLYICYFQMKLNPYMLNTEYSVDIYIALSIISRRRLEWYTLLIF